MDAQSHGKSKNGQPKQTNEGVEGKKKVGLGAYTISSLK